MTAATAPFGADWSATLRRGSSDELDALLRQALAWCDEADEIALAHFRRKLRITAKPDRTLVTEADRGIEAHIRERIVAAHPDHGILGEEEGASAAGAGDRWILDPIDGTHNFVRGIPLFATLLAFERGGEMQIGVVSAPALRERWYAVRGGGAWAVGGLSGSETPRPLHVSAIARIEDGQVLHGSRTDLATSGLAPGLDALLARAWRERGFGDFWSYMLVAEGAAEAMVEIGVNPWDLAAPLVVVEEAGGRLTDLRGDRAIDRRSALATNGRLHEHVLVVLGGTTDGSQDPR